MYTIAIPLKDIDINNIIIKDLNPNKLIPNSSFCKLMYSTNDCYITSIPICIYLHQFPSNYKYKFILHREKNNENINIIKNIEENLLQKYSDCLITNKRPVFKLYTHLISGVLKINYDIKTHPLFIIKLIGIWESQNEYGITYRISNHS
tara:strand:- start:9976 stop:10422 length:447 start_codon:yes stop_codon:yes gene_type:complete